MIRRIILLVFLLVTLQMNASVKITEVMTCNISSHLDRNSWNFPGYLELFNASTESINLKGYTFEHHNLTAKGNLKYKWKWRVTTNIEVPSNSYLLLYFDKDSLKSLHSSTKLDSDGGVIYVSDPSGVVVDEFSYLPMTAHIAYGRDSLGNYGYMLPTPKKANQTIYSSLKEYRVSPVSFVGAKPGLQSGPISLSLKCATPNVTIHYTLDGSEPTKESPILKDGSVLSIDSTTSIKAIAYSDSLLPSQSLTGTFIFMDEKHESCGGFTLPILSLTMNDEYLTDDTIGIAVRGVNGAMGNCVSTPANFNQDWKRPAVMEYFVDGKLVLCEETEVAVSGGCTRTYTNIPKSLKIKTGKKIGADKELFEYPFFADRPGVKFDAVKIRAGGNANTAMGLRFRDGYFNRLASEMNVDYHAYQPVAYYLNGVYQGLMGLREHLSDGYVTSNFGLAEDEMDIIKVNDAKVGDKLAYNELVRFLKNNDPKDSSYYETADKMMDIEEYIDYMIIEQYATNVDWPFNNIMCWRDRENGKFRWILYDVDVTMGATPSDVSVDPIKWSTGEASIPGWREGRVWRNEIYANLMENPQFKTRFLNRWLMYLGTTLNFKNVTAVYDSLATLVSEEFCATFDGLNPKRCNGKTFLLNNSQQRIQNVVASLGEYYGYPYNSGLSYSANVEGVRFIMNKEVVNKSSFSGYWLNKLMLELEAVAPAGFKFNRWDLSFADTTYSVYTKVLSKKISKRCKITAVFDSVGCELPTVVINELCASADSTVDGLVDDYGLTPDWVELYNYGEDTVDVAGLYLTDKLTKPTKYQIPYSYENTKIAPHGYLMLWADGKSFRGATHTNFKMENAKGARLALVQVCGDTTIIDQVSYVKMQTNGSYGRRSDASDSWRSFSPKSDTLSVGVVSFVSPKGENGTEGYLSLGCPTPDDVTKVYDGKALSYDVLSSGNYEGEDVIAEYSVDSGMSWSQSVPEIKEKGSLGVTVRATHPKYKSAECAYELEVTPADMELMCPIADSTVKVYDGTMLSAEAEAKGIEGDTITIEYSTDGGSTWVEAAPSIVRRGVQKVQVRAHNPNYNMAECEYELEVTPADMELMCPIADSTVKVYDGTMLSAKAEAKGIEGDTITIEYSANEGGTWVETVPGIVNRGVQKIKVRAHNPNYNMAECAYELEVTPADMELMCPIADSTVKVYDGVMLNPMAEAKGVAGDTITIEYSTDGGNAWGEAVPGIVNSGVQKVQVRAHNPNYNMVECEYELVVSPAELEIVCPDVDSTIKVYDGKAMRPMAEAFGLDGDTITIEYSTDGGNAWGKAVPSIVNRGVQKVQVRAHNPNYNMAECEYELVVSPAELEIVCPDVDSTIKVYDGKAMRPMAEAFGLEGDTIVIEYSTDGGTSWGTVVPSIVNRGVQKVQVRAHNPNYNPAECEYELVVDPAELEIVCPDADSTVKVYDGKVMRPMVEAFGLEGDTIIVEYSVDGGNSWGVVVPGMVNSGVQQVQVRVNNPNYNMAECEYELVVNPAELDLVCPNADSTIKVYDGKPMNPMAEALGLEGDTIIVEYSVDGGISWGKVVPSIINRGVQKVQVRAHNPNYHPTECEYELEVTPAELEIMCPNAEDVTKEYDGEFLSPIVQLEGVYEGDSIAMEYSVDGGSSWGPKTPGIVEVGSLWVKVRTNNPNYELAECDYVLTVKEYTGIDPKFIQGDDYRVFDLNGRLVRKSRTGESLLRGLKGAYLIRIYEDSKCVSCYRVVIK
ncbi:MAG: CotH kinase family protein [Paludibacteraceae bacterium]|nr:CotH kinase family protein [Paludibacteraceae bacterium]